MKSAYEIAMERLEKESGPSRKLTDEQKAQIAEIDRTYEAKIAEQKLSYDARIASAQSAEDLEKLKAELAEAVASLESRSDKEKEAVWEGE